MERTISGSIAPRRDVPLVVKRDQECKVDKPNPGGRRVFTTEMEDALPELFVVVKAEINGVPITVILDSGVGPSVLDYGTLKNLGPAKHLSENPGKIYRLSQEPVVVIGSADLTVDLGDDQIVLQRLQISV